MNEQRIQMVLYRYDELIYISNSNNLKASRVEKKNIKSFKILGLRIVISNLKIVTFLDDNFLKNNNSFKPFNKYW